MANCGPTVVKSDGIACLLRRFETHIDAGGVFTRLPEKAYRPGSIIDLPALGPINRSNPLIPTPNGSKLVVKSSSKSVESSVLSSPVNGSKLALAGEMKVSDKGGTSSQQAATGDENASRTNSMDDHEPGKSLASSTQTSHSSDASKDSSSSNPQKSEANLPTVIENHGQAQFRSSEDGSESLATASTKNSGSTNELDAAERKAAKGREAGNAVATRFIFKQSFGENQNATVYLDDPSSPSTSNKVKQLARSMDNLCGNSSAPTTKERNVFHHVDKSTRAGKWSDSAPSTAPAAIPSLANDERTAARAKKPPPVPKKNPKVSREAEGRELNSARTGGQSDANPLTGESQTMPNLSQAKKPAARPSTLFPDHQVADNDGGGSGDENNNDDDDEARHKSLPILGSAKDDDQRRLIPTLNAQKNTLYPCNRQKTRTRILSTETNSTDDQGLPYSPFVNSPMSLGARTPPDIDSLVDNKANPSDKKYSPGQQSTTAGNDFTRSRSSDQLLSVEATAAGDVFDSHEAFDPDSFLSDAFDFLGHSNPTESETKTTSPLKSWTDTWCKASQKRLSKASDRVAEAAGSSREQRPTEEGYRKEPLAGNLSDKTKPQDEKTAKTKSTNLLNVGLNKTSNGPVKPSGRDEKTKTGEDAEPPTHFGVVLRRTDAPTSLFRRSSIASLVSKEGPSAPKKTNSRHENLDSRPATSRKATESFRTADRTSVNLNRKPSMVSAGTSALPLTAGAPSQRPAHKALLGGRNVVSRASSTLNRTAASDSPAAAGVFGARVARQSTASANKLESELNDIDRAFTFLDRS